MTSVDSTLSRTPASALLDRQVRMLRTAMGPAIAAALADPQVLEIQVNPDSTLWLDRLGEGCADSGVRITPQDAERIIRLVASHLRVEVNAAAPFISAELPETGERFSGVLPPITRAPAFAIRKRAIQIIPLAQYVVDEAMTEKQALALRQAVRERRNIVIAGGTGTGKTTLANSLLQEMAASGDRVLTLEETPELQCTARNAVSLRCQRGIVSMRDLTREILGYSPDRIVVGELRGAEALDLLKAWATGHPGGLTTLHANSARGALTRLEHLAQEAVVTIHPALVADAVDIVVFLSRRAGMHRVEEMIRVHGQQGGAYQVEPLEPSLSNRVA